MRNKLSEFKILEEEKRYVGFINEKAKFIKWMYSGDTAFDKRQKELISSLSDIELHVIKKRKRIYIPESLTNPFFLEYKPLRSYTSESACINFPKTNNRKVDLDLTGVCKAEYDSIIKMVNATNKNRTVDSSDKLKVLVSPIRPSLRGKPIKNSFAIKVTYPDGSISCFYHLVGYYHIATKISE
tara:strand:- start:1219 stop:1770 length:552 start_codon:yes stop_codon:yes gene_type:complete